MRIVILVSDYSVHVESWNNLIGNSFYHASGEILFLFILTVSAVLLPQFVKCTWHGRYQPMYKTVLELLD